MPLVSFTVVICVVQTPNIAHGFFLSLQGAIHVQETARTFAGLLKYFSPHIYRKTHVWLETKRKLTFQGS